MLGPHLHCLVHMQRPRVVATELRFEALEQLGAAPVVGQLELDGNRSVERDPKEAQVGALGVSEFFLLGHSLPASRQFPQPVPDVDPDVSFRRHEGHHGRVAAVSVFKVVIEVNEPQSREVEELAVIARQPGLRNLRRPETGTWHEVVQRGRRVAAVHCADQRMSTRQ